VTLVPLTVRPDPRTRSAALAMSDPLPRLSDSVHAVTATFATAGWTLRFGPSGHQTLVARLADADGAARRLVGAALGLPPASVRVRIAPDAQTLSAVRRGTAQARSTRRGRGDDM
jgi:hypothetical protein